MNSNDVILLNCKRHNLRIHVLNKFNGYTGYILAPGSFDKSIVYGIPKQGNKSTNWKVILAASTLSSSFLIATYQQFSFLLMVPHQHQEVMTTPSVFGVSKQGSKEQIGRSYQLSDESGTILASIEIIQSDFRMSVYDNKYQQQIIYHIFKKTRLFKKILIIVLKNIMRRIILFHEQHTHCQFKYKQFINYEGVNLINLYQSQRRLQVESQVKQKQIQKHQCIIL